MADAGNEQIRIVLVGTQKGCAAAAPEPAAVNLFTRSTGPAVRGCTELGTLVIRLAEVRE